MPKIFVTKPFRLNLGPVRGIISIPAGVQTVTDEIAAHPYTHFHISPMDVAEPVVADGGPELPPNGPPINEVDDTGQTTAPIGGGETILNPAPIPDERAVLIDEARALGIAVDKRWGVARLRTEISAMKVA